MRVKSLLAALVVAAFVANSANAAFEIRSKRTPVTSGPMAGFDIVTFYAWLPTTAPERAAGATGLQSVSAIMTLNDAPGHVLGNPADAGFAFKLYTTGTFPSIDVAGTTQMGEGLPGLGIGVVGRDSNIEDYLPEELAMFGSHIDAGIGSDAQTTFGTITPTPTTPGTSGTVTQRLANLTAYSIPFAATGAALAPNPTTWNYAQKTTGWDGMAAKTLTAREFRVDMTNVNQFDTRATVIPVGSNALGAVFAMAVVPHNTAVRVYNPALGGLAPNKIDTITPFDYTDPVPEPGTLGVLGIAVIGLLARRRRVA